MLSTTATHHQAQQRRIRELDGMVEALRADYEAMQQMFLGERMPFATVLTTLQEAEDTLNRA